jgi:hypothetical protein
MSKSQNSKKSDKKKPAKTKDEKRQAKRDKKEQKDSPGVIDTIASARPQPRNS